MKDLKVRGRLGKQKAEGRKQKAESRSSSFILHPSGLHPSLGE
jgi:hypothetical protein